MGYSPTPSQRNHIFYPTLKRSCFFKRTEITSSVPSTRVLGAPRASHNLGAPLLLIISARLLYFPYRLFKLYVYIVFFVFTFSTYHYFILSYSGPKSYLPKRAEMTSSAFTRVLGAPRASHNLGAPRLLICVFFISRSVV